MITFLFKRLKGHTPFKSTKEILGGVKSIHKIRQVTTACSDLISNLSAVNQTQRLGTYGKGIQSIRDHR